MMKDSRPQVSIIIPAYNAAKYLRRCLDSCLAQTFQAAEIICVDDGSTDGTWDILMQYPSVKSIRQINKGVVSAREKGIQGAKGDYICFVDSDDWLPLDALAYLVSGATGGADIVIGDHILAEPNERLTRREAMSFHGEMNGWEYVARVLSHEHGYLWGKIIRRQLCQNMGVDPKLRLNEDLLINVITGFRAKKVKVIEHPVYFYWWGSETSLCKRNDEESLGWMFSVCETISRFVRSLPPCGRTLIERGCARYVIRNGARLFSVGFNPKNARFVLSEMRRTAIHYPLIFLSEVASRKTCGIPLVAELVSLRFARAIYAIIYKMRGLVL